MSVPTVFISSTIEDLKDYRDKAVSVINNLDFKAIPCERWGASGQPSLEECLDRVDESDVVVAIVAHRYGWKPSEPPLAEPPKSITRLECERAQNNRENPKELLVFMVDPKMDWPAEFKENYRLIKVLEENGDLESAKRDIDESEKELAAFKKWLNTITTRAVFASVDDFGDLLTKSLHKWVFRHLDQFPEYRPKADLKKYLTALKEDTQYLDIRGVKSGDGKVKQFQLADLYIPLKTQILHQQARKAIKGQPGEMPEPQTMLLQDTLSEKRLLIKGDPGAGKSTFCRLLVHSLCRRLLGESPLEKIKIVWPEKPPLPVFVRIGELTEHVRHCREQKIGDAPTTDDSADWLLHFLEYRSKGKKWGLDRNYFEQQLTDGNCLLLLDGLDEAPDDIQRENICNMTKNIIQAYKKCSVVLTSRPAALDDRLPLDHFTPVTIAPLDEPAINNFLDLWCGLLYADAAGIQANYRKELGEAVISRPDIRRMAQTPIMLTCLAVVHWSQHKLPDQRAELYEAILAWLFEQRKKRKGRLPFRRCRQMIQALALAMFCHLQGRQRQVSVHWAGEQLTEQFDGKQSAVALRKAEAFLRDEMVDSGIIVDRSGQLEFWHLSFQEYLAACEIAGLPEKMMQDVIFENDHLFQSEWREVMLLLGGVLHKSGIRRLNLLVDEIIAQTDISDLKNAARTVALLSSMNRDLRVFDYTPANKHYPALLQQVNGIFDKKTYRSITIQQRCEIADELARNGDPRFTEFEWISVPGGEFLMGAQNENEDGDNYDEKAYSDESPVHRVKLSAYEILKYPVTVAQYARFVENEGYKKTEFWTAGEFGKFDQPEEWDSQQEHPARPVVSVSWYEAAAFAAYLRQETGQQIFLPGEAQWERAARGKNPVYRMWSWGNEQPDSQGTNWDKTGLGDASPVGVFPGNATDNGILDMSGNVLEWCEGRYRKDSESRVLRGGAFSDYTGDLRCSYRDSIVNPDIRDYDFGFRLVRLFES